jgi:hypothetical protein
MKLIKYFGLFILSFLIAVGAGYGINLIKNTKTALISSTVPGVKQNIDISFSPKNAPTDSLKGQITNMTGWIDWQGRTATESTRISSPITIQQGENLQTKENSSLSLTFLEVGTVEMSEKTEIDIIQTLPSNIVFLQASGSAKYTKTGSDPITIRAKKLIASMEGELAVSVDEEKPLVTLTQKSGSTTIAFNDLKYVSHLLKISEGQTYTFNYGTRKGVLK